MQTANGYLRIVLTRLSHRKPIARVEGMAGPVLLIDPHWRPPFVSHARHLLPNGSRSLLRDPRVTLHSRARFPVPFQVKQGKDGVSQMRYNSSTQDLRVDDHALLEHRGPAGISGVHDEVHVAQIRGSDLAVEPACSVGCIATHGRLLGQLTACTQVLCVQGQVALRTQTQALIGEEGWAGGLCKTTRARARLKKHEQT
jgi:hypothetical protein